MNKKSVIGTSLILTATALLAGCVAMDAGNKAAPVAKAPTDAEIVALLKASFKNTPSAGHDRLDQSPLQKACT